MDYVKQNRLVERVNCSIPSFKAGDSTNEVERSWNVGVDCFTFITTTKKTIIKITDEFVVVEQKGFWVKFPMEMVKSITITSAGGDIDGVDFHLSHFTFA